LRLAIPSWFLPGLFPVLSVNLTGQLDDSVMQRLTETPFLLPIDIAQITDALCIN
jgi:hypothetical protein